MQNSPKPEESGEAMNSSIKAIVWLLEDAEKGQKKVGEIRVVGGSIVVEADIPEDEQYLHDLMRDSWRMQLGIPTIAKKDGEIVRKPDGKVEFSGYASFRNSTPDAVLEAFIDYTNVLGVLRAEQQPL